VRDQTPRRRLVLAGLPLLSPALAQASSEAIGTAWMKADGTVVLDLIARQGAGVGHGCLTYPPGHPERPAIPRHLGGLRPGEVKPVPPFP
jgi:hypothetical protein